MVYVGDIGEGSLFAFSENEKIGSCPLKGTKVKTKIAGFLAEVEVVQEFENSFNKKIEAVYTFPLGAEAAVFEMKMVIGNRIIESQIKRRDEARKIYEKAKTMGHAASLLEQERPNMFTQSVANILPKEKITVTIRYFEILKIEEGWYEFVFPMVVMPRYIPGNSKGITGLGWSQDTDRVPDASKITPKVVPPEMRAGHDISIEVEIDSGFEVSKVESKLHEIEVEKIDGNRKVILKEEKTIPNKDFILRFRTLGKEITSAVLTDHNGDGGHFLIMVQPPERIFSTKVLQKEMFFVIDDSGSMGGWPIDKAKETMKHCVKGMNKHDTFQMISFSNETIKLFNSANPNSKENMDRALRFLGERTGRGGTEMLPAIREALSPPYDADRIRQVCLMTDGGIGNEFEILDAIKRNLRHARFFVFGVGNSSNRYLIDEMVEAGKGESFFVTTEDDGKKPAKRFYEMIANPLMTDIRVDFEGVEAEEIFPGEIKDLYSSKPVIICGRFKKPAKGKAIIKGHVKGKTLKIEIPLDFTKKIKNSQIAMLWARKKISNLMAKDYLTHQYKGKMESEGTVEEITKTALKYHLMSQYTSLVAVEKKTTRMGNIETIPVPVEMPDSVSYKGVFGSSSTLFKRMARFDMQMRGPEFKSGSSGSFYAYAQAKSMKPRSIMDFIKLQIEKMKQSIGLGLKPDMEFIRRVDKEIKSLSKRLKLKKTVEEKAIEIAKLAINANRIKNKNAKAVSAAAIWISATLLNYPLGVSRLERASRIKESDLIKFQIEIFGRS